MQYNVQSVEDGYKVQTNTSVCFNKQLVTVRSYLVSVMVLHSLTHCQGTQKESAVLS